jgi:hypothetical protein
MGSNVASRVAIAVGAGGVECVAEAAVDASAVVALATAAAVVVVVAVVAAAMVAPALEAVAVLAMAAGRAAARVSVANPEPLGCVNASDPATAARVRKKAPRRGPRELL